MHCRSARSAMVRLLAGDLDEVSRAALDQHVTLCTKCAGRLKTYAAIMAACARLDTPPLSGDLAAECDRVFQSASPRGRAPARHTTGPTPAVKAAVGAAVAAAIILVSTGAALVAGRYGRPADVAARVTYSTGQVGIGSGVATPGPSMHPGDVVLAGTVLRTGREGLLRLDTGHAELWVDGSSALRPLSPLKAELQGGRVFVSVAGTADSPVELLSPAGKAACARGSFVARASPLRLTVTCLSGQVTVKASEGAVTLSPGEQALAAHGRVSEHVRRLPVRTARHWLTRFQSPANSPLSRRAAALLPMPAQETALPETLRIARLSVRVWIRGPLVLAAVEAVVQNTGSRTWQGRLDPARILWPPAVCGVPSDECRIAAGSTRTLRSAAITVMQPTGEQFRFAIVPEGWTQRPVGRLSLELEGTAAGGFRAVHCPTHDTEITLRRNRVQATLARRDLPPGIPIVFECAFPSGPAHDLLLLPAAPGTPARGLLAGRGYFQSSRDAVKIERLLLAFHTAADYGALGRAYAQEAADALTHHLTKHAFFGWTAHDGGRILPPRIERWNPIIAQKLGIALWELQPQAGGSAARDLLREAMAAAAGQPAAVIMITGRAEPASAFPSSGPAEGEGPVPRPYVLQVGAAAPAEAYGQWCGQRGGACLALAGDLTPEGAIINMLSNMGWEGLITCAFSPGTGVRSSRTLTRTGLPSNHPIVVALEADGSNLTGRLSAATADGGLARSVSLSTGPHARIELARDLAAALSAELAALTHPAADPLPGTLPIPMEGP